MDREGTVIADKYRLEELAGRGGMACVWRATTMGAAGFRRAVAVKRILPALESDTKFLKMFVEEARVCAELMHPNIVQIHDFGEDRAGRYYLVMEWIEGLDLNKLLYAYELFNAYTPWPLVAAITIEVLRGLTAAHERPRGPVIHRDVNPSNILVHESGVVKVTDFGLARAADRGRITNPDIVKGKLSYLAPELTFGVDPNPRTDLFSVGVVMWEALAGRKLFTGEEDVDVLLGVRAAEVPPLQDERPDIPDALYEIVHRALAREPADRFRDADSMGRALAGELRNIERRTDTRAIAATVQHARRQLAKHEAAEAAASADGAGSKPLSIPLAPGKTGPMRPPPRDDESDGY